MARRPATVTQADLARSFRAWRDVGVPAEKLRIVHRPDGVAVEPIGEREEGRVGAKKTVVL
jgi:hypothetical protein